MSVAEAGELLGPDAIIGLSTHSEEQIAAAAERRVDYISVGPIWETPTKAGRARRSASSSIAHAAANAAHPFFAIGGIDAGNAAQVVARRRAAALRGAGDPRRRRPRPRPPKRCARAFARRSARWRPVAERAAQAQAARRQRTARADGARLRQGRGAQPGGARSAGAAGRGRAADGGDDRRGRRRR